MGDIYRRHFDKALKILIKEGFLDTRMSERKNGELEYKISEKHLKNSETILSFLGGQINYNTFKGEVKYEN